MSGAFRRCFLALPLPAAVSENIAPFLKQCRERLPAVKWVKPGNLHLTLHFFGATAEEEIRRIIPVIKAVASEEQAMSFCLENIGFFPGDHKIRVIWAGLKGDVGRLKACQGRIAGALRAAGFPIEERPFVPHVTLGRSRETLREFPPDLKPGEAFPFLIREIILYESKISTEGPVYTPVETFPFPGAQAA